MAVRVKIALMALGAIILFGLTAQAIAGTQDQAVTGAQEKWECPASVSAIKNPVALTAKSVSAGQKLALSNGCVDCHGAGGFGDGPAAGSIHPRPANWHSGDVKSESDACLFWKLTTGRRPMPGLKSVPERERWDIINYIRSLQKE